MYSCPVIPGLTSPKVNGLNFIKLKNFLDVENVFRENFLLYNWSLTIRYYCKFLFLSSFCLKDGNVHEY